MSNQTLILEFGEYIKRLRRDKGISLRELARRTGVSQPYLSQLETGKYKNPSPEKLGELSKGLGISYAELMLNTYLKGHEKELKELLKD